MRAVRRLPRKAQDDDGILRGWRAYLFKPQLQRSAAMLKWLKEERRRALFELPALPLQGWHDNMAREIDVFLDVPTAVNQFFPHGIPERLYDLRIVQNTYYQSFFFLRGTAITPDLRLVAFESPLVFGRAAISRELLAITSAVANDPHDLWWVTFHQHRVVFPRLFMP